MARVSGLGSNSARPRKRGAQRSMVEKGKANTSNKQGAQNGKSNRHRDDNAIKMRASRADRHSRRSNVQIAPSSDSSTASSDSSEEDDEEKDDDDNDEGEEQEDNSTSSSSESDDEDTSRNRRAVTRNKRAANTQRSASNDPRTLYYFVKDLNVKALRQQEALSRFRYLLGLGELFRKFVNYKAEKDDEFRAILDMATRENQKAARAAIRGPKSSRSRRQNRNSRIASISEAEEIMEEPEEEEKITVFSESPGFVKGELRQYQIDGLNWLISLFVNNINGILADEMGLGKTFQCIAFLAYLRHIQNIRGPHLIIVPKSTVQNWAREFSKWTSEVEVLVLAGDKEERADLIKNKLLGCKFDVCITSFELVIKEKNALQKIAWQYVIVDEAHRIKNEESILSKIMRVLFSRHRLLITGTPLQNNLHELWALLNFLLPDVFSDADVFDDWFSKNDESEEEEEEEETSRNSTNPKKHNKEINVADTANEVQVQAHKRNQDEMIEQLRSILSPFLMRRVKRDVEHTLLPKKEINLYVGMTAMQIEWYQRLLEKDLDAVNNTSKAGGSKEGKMRLLNVVMQLRKCCNHPYLFEGAEPGPPFTTDEHLVLNSGKMILLDKLLSRLKAQGSRVLIFSQMGRMLDILEDYCSLRDYEYCRIDGSTVHEDRVAAIDEYNKPGSSKFLFLLTTRAGGLGINLTTADQVIIYDSDWNPQADLQAMDRAHRIGQTKQVYVYRFVVEHAIEEKVLERAAHKLRLDQLVIQQGSSGRNSAQEKAKAAASKEELANMIRHGAQEVLDQKNSTVSSDMSIDEIIAAGEKRTEELNGKYSDLGLDELRKFTLDKPPSNPTPIINRNNKVSNEFEFRHHHRRARNNAMYHEELAVQERDREGRNVKTVPLRAPKQLPLHDYQFFPPELQELQAKELAWYRKVSGIRLGAEDYSSDEEDDSEERNAEIEKARPLTEEELNRKEELIQQGFPNFSKRDFYHFLNLVVKHGGAGHITDEILDKMCESWPEKPADDIKRYHKVFFERYHEIADYERYMNLLEAGENKAKKQNHRMDLLKRKIEQSLRPLSLLQITQPSGGSATRHRFSEANDRFLLVQMNKFGLDTPNLSEKIRDSIQRCGLFDFDWYFMSRSAAEIGRRCTSLLNIIVKEMDGTGAARGTKRKGRPPSVKSESEELEHSKKRKEGPVGTS